jgi:predicted lipoprotein with Yx(FWY)xxD motif
MATIGIGKFGSATLSVTAAIALVAGCSSSGSSTASNGSTGAARAGGLDSRSTAIGTVLVDSAGHTVYELDGDTAASGTCTASCQAIWPPVMTNGTQLVVNGHPAFTFTGDRSAGQTTGQGLQDQWGHWHVLDANGNPITTGTTTSTTSAISSGYKY